MNYASIFFDDTVNGIGIRTSLFVSGCAKTPPCKGCWSPQARAFDYGKLFTQETKNSIIESLKHSYVRGISILGGEPMDNLNDGILMDLVEKIKRDFSEKTIFCWSGRKFEQLVDDPLCFKFLKYIDMLRDGEFIEEQKDITQYLQGSKNQRCIDVQESLNQGSIVLWED